jgi:fumarylpyruvate hydrolase
MTRDPAKGTDWVFEPESRPAVPVTGDSGLFPVRRIYCVAQNYREHAREMGASLRTPPFFFTKPADAVCTRSTIAWPGRTSNLHHEVELVVALAGGGANLAPEQARAAIFGYAVGVDLTRRDLQAEAKKAGRPWSTAKSFDQSAPISSIRRVADCGQPENAAISLRVNDELRQQGNTAEMTWSVPEIISQLSSYFELKAGDLIFTGTPAGVGELQPGDFVECEIAAIGSLSFRMGQPSG